MPAPLAALLASGLAFSQSGFAASPTGWRAVAARPEIAPRASVAADPSRGEPGALALAGGGNSAASGGWERNVEGVTAGRWYRLVAHYREAGLPNPNWQVVARLDWRGADGDRVGQPDYAWRSSEDLGWTRLALDCPAPDGARAVAIQLQVRDAGAGVVYWDDVALSEIPAPPPRPVSIAAVRLRPKGLASAAASVQAFVELARREVPAGTDLILLPEGLALAGISGTYADAAEPIPGESTRALGELARSKRAWVVAGLYERDGARIYNTAVLLDREGRLAGRYRKVYLPREEIEGGLTAGSSYPTFATDFGTVGLMICWDVQFADPARALALGGAELLLMPIAGGSETLGRARAIENRVFIASSGYDYPTEVIDPDGRTVARAETEASVALARIDLARRYLDPWLGDMRGRLRRELRFDVPVQAGSGIGMPKSGFAAWPSTQP